MSYRILSLDGGGAWALLQVKALIRLHGGETIRGHAVLRQYDLVAANSGGSLVLGGLLEDLTLGELLNYFLDEDKRRAIFSPLPWWGSVLNKVAGVGPRYRSARKLTALRWLLPKTGDMPVSRLTHTLNIIGHDGHPVHLLIVTFDYDRNRAVLFRSDVSIDRPNRRPTDPLYGTGADADTTTLAEAIHGSTNAPVNYFDRPALFGQNRYWDGGLTGCNNPVLAAVTEAMCRGHKADRIIALSIGTASTVLPTAPPGAVPGPYEAQRVRSSLFTDIGKVSKAVLGDPPDFATFVAHVATGAGAGITAESRIVRMNPLIRPVCRQGGWDAPGGLTEPDFVALRDMDMDAVAPADVLLINDYGNRWLSDQVPNQPIRMDSDFTVEIGYQCFSEAESAWAHLRSLHPA